MNANTETSPGITIDGLGNSTDTIDLGELEAMAAEFNKNKTSKIHYFNERNRKKHKLAAKRRSRDQERSARRRNRTKK